MSKSKQIYVCSKCGFETSKWNGKCSNCGEWNTLTEKEVSATDIKNIIPKSVNVELLKNISTKKDERIVVNDPEIDRMFGGGIVKDSVSIITAPPGTGKSTFALSLSGKLSQLGYKILYASGEESESQIKNRANRILTSSLMENIYIYSDSKRRLENIIAAINQIKPDLLILDSIQTFTLDRCLPSRAGSPTQVIECANEIISLCKDPLRPMASIIIGQMVKNDELAGPRQLEHLVDAVFYLDGDPYEDIRICTSSKNRFGELETAFFDISNGMNSITNPSEYLLTKRPAGEEVSGSAITIIKEGSRPLAVEIEALVNRSFTPYPTRLGEGLRKDQLNILASILEQKGNVNLYDRNIILKSVGNIKLNESSIGLPVIISILSSHKNIPISTDIVFIGEVGLTGEIKKTPSLEAKIKEAERMGFKEIIIPNQDLKNTYKIKISKYSNIKDVINDFFSTTTPTSPTP